jgi:hemin uptake protein HemP
MTSFDERPVAPPPPGAVAAAPRRIDSDQLLQGAQQIQILHRGQSYCLRVTSLGKLILTK